LILWMKLHGVEVKTSQVLRPTSYGFHKKSGGEPV